MTQHVVILINGHLLEPCAKTHTFQIRSLVGARGSCLYVTYRTYDIVIGDYACQAASNVRMHRHINGSAVANLAKTLSAAPRFPVDICLAQSWLIRELS